MFILPAFAGEFDNALKDNNKVFAYVYKPYCGYCLKFDPIFKKLERNYNGKCKFLKMDINSDDGYKIARQYNVRYVPYVVAIDTQSGHATQITAACLIDYACVDAVVSNFVK